MRVKPKVHTPKKKKAKTGKSTEAVLSKNAKLFSQFARKIIADLYPYALENKSKAEITLVSDAEHSKEYRAKIIVLNEFKQKRLIKKYTLLKPKEIEIQPSKPRRPSELEIEVNPDMLYQQLPDDYMSFSPCNALIEFHPRGIVKRYEKIEQRKMIEEGFKTEQVLICNGLEFGLETGSATYGNTVTNFLPDGQEYNLLKALMLKRNKRVDYKKLCKVVFGNQRKWGASKKANSSIKHDIGFVIRNIKSKLGILRGKNKNLFFSCNGYRIVCNP